MTASAADKYKNIIADFPEAETVMNDETHHGDAVMGLLKCSSCSKPQMCKIYVILPAGKCIIQF